MCIPSKYESAKVHYLDVPGLRQTFVIVRFEGDTGTGVLQEVLLGIGWNDGRFAPVLLETASYRVDAMANQRHLRLEYSLQKKETKVPFLELRYHYSERNTSASRSNENPSDDASPTYAFEATWSERLPWNAERHSFYRKDVERDKEQVYFPVVRQLAVARQAIERIRLDGSCESPGAAWQMIKAAQLPNIFERPK